MRLKHFAPALLCVAIADVTPAVAASDLDALLAMSMDSLLDVKIVTASKSSQSALDAAAPVSVVTAEDIRAYGYRTLGDILRSMPGLQVSYDRSYQYLGVRGINRKDYNSRILVLLDGRRMNENMYDSSFIDRTFLVDPEVIERVEFVAGPGSSLYGNNALLGVVNVITKKGGAVDGLRLLGEAGDAASGRIAIEYGKTFDNGADLLLAMSSFRSEGEDRYFSEHADTARGLDGETANKFFGKLSHGDFTFSAGMVERDKEIPTAPYSTVFNDPDARIVDRETHLGANYATSLSDVLAFSAQLSLGAYDFRNDYHYDSANPDPLNHDEVHGRWWNAEARIEYSGLRDHQIIAGLEYQSDFRQDYRNRDVSPAYLWYDQLGDSSRYGVFINDRIRLSEQWQLDLGARYDNFSIQGKLTDCSADPCVTGPFSQDGDALNPRAALIYKPTPDTAFKLLYGSAFRAANPTEIAFVIPGQPLQISNADPEKLTTREATVEHFLSKNFKVWADAFQYDFKGLIDTDPDTNEFINALDFRSRGILIGSEWKSEDGRQARVSYTYADVTDSSDARLDDAPRHQAKFNYAMPVAGPWRLGMEALYTGPRLTLGGDELGGHTLVNLTLNSGTRWKDMQLSASVYNLLDKDYADPARGSHDPIDKISQNGRGWRLQVAYRF